MKKIIYSILSASIIASCSNEFEQMPEAGSELVPMTFITENYENASSRTSLVEGSKVQWLKDDKITVFSNQKKFTFGNNITGTQPVKKGVFEGVAEIDESYFALYPADESSSITETTTDNNLHSATITTTLKNSQDATLNNFAPNTNISIAFSLHSLTQYPTISMKLHFQNAAGLIKLNLAEDITEDFSKVKLEGNNNELIAGKINIKATEKKFSIGNISATTVTAVTTVSNEGGNKEITLSAKDGETLQNGTDNFYYIVVAPTEFTNGFKLVLENQDGTIKKIVDTNSAVTIENGKIYPVNITATNLKDYTEPVNKDVYVTAITELAPKDGKDILELTLDNSVNISNTENAKSDFTVSVTNGSYSGNIAVENIEVMEGGNKLILTLAEPVYWEDEINVSYSGEDITSAELPVVISTDESVAPIMYENVVYFEDFSDGTTGDLFEVGTHESQYSQVLPIENCTIDENGWLKINMPNTIQIISDNKNVDTQVVLNSKQKYTLLNDAIYTFSYDYGISSTITIGNGITNDFSIRYATGKNDIFKLWSGFNTGVIVNENNKTLNNITSPEHRFINGECRYTQNSSETAGTPNEGEHQIVIKFAAKPDRILYIDNIKLTEKALRPFESETTVG